jgi:hypothetical protein
MKKSDKEKSIRHPKEGLFFRVPHCTHAAWVRACEVVLEWKLRMNGQVSSLERLEGQDTHLSQFIDSHQSESSLN